MAWRWAKDEVDRLSIASCECVPLVKDVARNPHHPSRIGNNRDEAAARGRYVVIDEDILHLAAPTRAEWTETIARLPTPYYQGRSNALRLAEGMVCRRYRDDP